MDTAMKKEHTRQTSLCSYSYQTASFVCFFSFPSFFSEICLLSMLMNSLRMSVSLISEHVCWSLVHCRIYFNQECSFDTLLWVSVTFTISTRLIQPPFWLQNALLHIVSNQKFRLRLTSIKIDFNRLLKGPFYLFWSKNSPRCTCIDQK